MILNVITIKDPWAQAIVYGTKRIENRKWAPKSSISVGDAIGIHVANSVDKDAIEYLRETGMYSYSKRRHHPGHIIGIGTYAGAYGEGDFGYLENSCPYKDKLIRIGDDLWFNGPNGLVIEKVWQLNNPIPAKGKLGIWKKSVDVVDIQRNHEPRKVNIEDVYDSFSAILAQMGLKVIIDDGVCEIVDTF